MKTIQLSDTTYTLLSKLAGEEYDHPSPAQFLEQKIASMDKVRHTREHKEGRCACFRVQCFEKTEDNQTLHL